MGSAARAPPSQGVSSSSSLSSSSPPLPSCRQCMSRPPPGRTSSPPRRRLCLQLEGEYRSRLAAAHSAVKKRLDYQVETANVLRRMEKKHMVDWIIGNVKASITPAQEAAALKKCISDLKALSAA